MASILGNDILETLEKDGYVYHVVFDVDGYYNMFDSKYAAEFESNEDKNSYRKKFIDGTLEFYGVIKNKACECCKQLNEDQSLWGISAGSPKEALDFFLNY